MGQLNLANDSGLAIAAEAATEAGHTNLAPKGYILPIPFCSPIA